MDRNLKYLANDPKEREFIEYMRCSTNTTTIQLNLLAALETAIPNVNTRGSINLHIIGADQYEFAYLTVFGELLHLLQSLKTLQLSFVGLDMVEDLEDDSKAQNLHTLWCCTMCTKIGRSISITTWRGPYHAYVDTELYKTPDLAAAFRSGFAVYEQADWYPTITHLDMLYTQRFLPRIERVRFL
jgi:splicing suppressor protein 51